MAVLSMVSENHATFIDIPNDTELTDSDLSGVSSIKAAFGAPKLTINLTSANSSLTSISSPIASVTLTGSKTLTLSGTSTYTGSTTIDTNAKLLGNISNSSDVTVNGIYDISGVARALNNVSGTGTLTNTVTSGTAKILTLNSSANTTFSGTIDGSKLSLTKMGSEILTLSGTNTYAGTTTISAGTLLITGSNTGLVTGVAPNLVTTAGTTTVSSGATLQIGNSGNTGSLASGITNNGTLIFNRLNDYTYAGAISGSGTVTQAGTGTLTLSGNFNNPINLNAGTLNIAKVVTDLSSGVAGALGIYTINFNGGKLQAGASTKLTNPTTLSAPATIDANGYTLTFSNAAGGSNGVISGAYGLIITDSSVSGNGIVIMSSDPTNLNSYTGPTTIGTGVTVKGSIATSVGVTVNGTYDLNGTALGLIDPSGSGTIQSSTSNAALTITSTNGSTFAGTLASTLSGLTKGGAGTLVLSAANNHSGSTAVSSGKLTLAHHTAASSGTIALDSGTTLEGNFASNAVIANPITIASDATLLATQAFTASGIISGSGSLIIDGGNNSGAGNTVTFAQIAANTYTGTTTLHGGATLSISSANHLSSTTALIMGNNTTLKVTGNCTLPPIVLS